MQTSTKASTTQETTFTIRELGSITWALSEVSPGGREVEYSIYSTLEAAFAECRPGARVFTRLVKDGHRMVAYEAPLAAEEAEERAALLAALPGMSLEELEAAYKAIAGHAASCVGSLSIDDYRVSVVVDGRAIAHGDSVEDALIAAIRVELGESDV